MLKRVFGWSVFMGIFLILSHAFYEANVESEVDDALSFLSFDFREAIDMHIDT